jgi:hypothetical protein
VRAIESKVRENIILLRFVVASEQKIAFVMFPLKAVSARLVFQMFQ